MLVGDGVRPCRGATRDPGAFSQALVPNLDTQGTRISFFAAEGARLLTGRTAMLGLGSVPTRRGSSAAVEWSWIWWRPGLLGVPRSVIHSVDPRAGRRSGR